ncbi:3-isopropylmalate dehydrogenase [Physocladia obscura]|uniref:3-isopropylmalate dehydrogenase n=1 Tax=Physocladia obscura TaxID=109957 RepID=A0AAD5SUN6_9FUNG|nr:3-isopropylmalate dehydrogenase [Physocladia obscura]
MSTAAPLVILLEGDGVGPEVVREAAKVLRAVAPHIQYQSELLGGSAIDATGVPLPQKTLSACRSAAAILLGAVGGPQWPRKDATTGVLGPRPEQGLLEIRKELDLFANIRPCVFPSDSLLNYSPLKLETVKGAEFIVVRELTGGIYFGERQEENAEGEAWDKMVYTVPEIQRITRIAAHLSLLTTPPRPIISVDKANVLASSRLWRRVVTQTLAVEFPTLPPPTHQLVDSCAMIMVKNPRALNGILLTENMFGDILSDEASVIPGSLGLLPSASLNGVPGGAEKVVGLYEPIHGSAPDIAGLGIANPIGTILSAALLLRYSLGLEKEAKVVEDAVRKVLDDVSSGGLGLRTKDLGGDATTEQIGDAVVTQIKKILA